MIVSPLAVTKLLVISSSFHEQVLSTGGQSIHESFMTPRKESFILPQSRHSPDTYSKNASAVPLLLLLCITCSITNG